VSGHLGRISEVAATEAALEYVGGNFDVVAGEEGYQGIIVIGPFNCLPQLRNLG